jgi:hypothetical protein
VFAEGAMARSLAPERLPVGGNFSSPTHTHCVGFMWIQIGVTGMRVSTIYMYRPGSHGFLQLGECIWVVD